MFILMRGELLQLDVDRETTIAKIPEGSVFGETVVLRNLEVSSASCWLRLTVTVGTGCAVLCWLLVVTGTPRRPAAHLGTLDRQAVLHCAQWQHYLLLLLLYYRVLLTPSA